MKWRQFYYVSVRLAFGCRSSPKLFDSIAQAISWIASNNYGIETIFHLLDDFLTIDTPDMCAGQRTMALLTMLFSRLNVPLAKHKCIGPADCLEYLGIILDSKNMVARLPMDKVQRIIKFIETLLGKSNCTKKELLQLLGHLNLTSRVILPGRSFVSYLISLSATVSNLHHHVYLDRHCQQDLLKWHRFCKAGMGFPCFMTQISQMHMTWNRLLMRHWWVLGHTFKIIGLVLNGQIVFPLSMKVIYQWLSVSSIP